MKEILNQNICLVLNRNWQAIGTRTPVQAIPMISTGAATALDMENMTPVKWEDWIRLVVSEGHPSIMTVRGAIRIPTVLIACRYAKVPMVCPSFSLKAIWERDGGRCQYTGEKLSRDEGSIDHVMPRSRGGASTFENCVLAHKKVNGRKANKTPEEAGLKLMSSPTKPKAVPITITIRNKFLIPDWEHFLVNN